MQCFVQCPSSWPLLYTVWYAIPIYVYDNGGLPAALTFLFYSNQLFFHVFLRASLASIAAVIAAMHRRKSDMLASPAVLPGLHEAPQPRTPADISASTCKPLVVDLSEDSDTISAAAVHSLHPSMKNIDGRGAASRSEGGTESETSPLRNLMSVGRLSRVAETTSFILTQVPTAPGVLRGSRTDAMIAQAAGGSPLPLTLNVTSPELTMWDDLLEITGGRKCESLLFLVMPIPLKNIFCRVFKGCR